MSKKTNKEKAEELMGTYLDALEEALTQEKVTGSILAEARKFFAENGIQLGVDGSAPSSQRSAADNMVKELRHIKGTGT